MLAHRSFQPVALVLANLLCIVLPLTIRSPLTGFFSVTCRFGSKYTSPYCIVGLGHVRTARTPIKPTKKDSAFWAEEFALDNLSDAVQSVRVSLFNRGKVKDRCVGEVGCLSPSLARAQQPRCPKLCVCSVVSTSTIVIWFRL